MNVFSSRSILASEEFRRILALPRRTPEDIEAVTDRMTEILKTPAGTMRLRPIQAMALLEMGMTRGMFGIIRVGGGKCLGRGTKVLMFDGTRKAVEDVSEDDVLMGPDSGPRRVVSTCKGIENLYRVVPVKGDPYVVNESHILSLKSTQQTSIKRWACNEGNRIRNLTVGDYLASSARFKANWKGWRTGVEFNNAPSLPDPYMLGAWLGDGSTNVPAITTADPEMLTEILAFAARMGVDVRVSSQENNESKTYHFTTSVMGAQWNRNPVTAWLRSLDVLGNKHIPQAYLSGTREDRLDVLAGLLDTDGALARTNYDYISKLERLADDVCFLARSLGLAAYKNKCQKTCTNNGVEGTYYRVSISGDCSVIPMRISRKRAPQRKQKKSVLVTGIHLEPMGPGEYFGFELEGKDRLFLLGDFTVTHNTAVSLLAPFVLQSTKPVLIVPAALKEKTEGDRLQLAKHFRVAKHLRILSYEELGRESKAAELEWYAPDLIITDETHKLKNKKAGVTRRVSRYMKINPKTKAHWEEGQRPMFVAMSGTMLNGGTIKSFAHILEWTHDKGAPIPLEWGELEEWASCLDESANFVRPSPGPLLQLATQADHDAVAAETDSVVDPELRLARKGFQRRLVETPGVISTAGDQVACSLYIRGHVYETNDVTEDNFHRLRGCKEREYDGWETPDGWPLTMAPETWRVARELALGMHSVWDPRPPPDWMAARKAWASFVRETLGKSRTLDTEKQVATACLNGELSRLEYDEWMNIKDTFRVNPKDVWHDDAALLECEKWAKKGPGIIWVDHVFFGEELSRRTGLSYFREEGLDAKGRNLQTLSNLIRDGKEKPCAVIVSTHSCQAGFNLQPWNRNLFTVCPSSAKTFEQAIGRTHRDGQLADQVEVDILLGSVEGFAAFDNATAQARMAVDVLGDSQKLLIADVTWPKMPTDGPQWNKVTRSISVGRGDGGGTPWWERGLEGGDDE